MIHAYDEIYLDDAMDTLGSAMEYATLTCKLDGQEFMDLFVVSGIADEFGRGNVTYISGMSGIELAQLVFRKCGKNAVGDTEIPYIDYPAEYWTGWILAYYQWYSAKSFANIFKRIPFESVINLYGVLHEADPSKSVEIFDNIMVYGNETNLARLRKERGLSQSRLAATAGISIRSIQLYEQRQTDINKAQHNHLKSLSEVLKCSVEDILE